jgi:hypothetical protein
VFLFSLGCFLGWSTPTLLEIASFQSGYPSDSSPSNARGPVTPHPCQCLVLSDFCLGIYHF